MLRYALLEAPTSANSWALFDQEGASYANYALRGDYYPRLYDLLPPNNELSPRLAEGFPSSILQEGAFYTATVRLKENLTWSDNSPLTAQDIAFTANTALEFQLGLNWATFYNPEKLRRVEALDDTTLKYYFAAPPSVGDWQYGALNAVFLSRHYWQPKLKSVEELLPRPEDDLRMETYQSEIDSLQAEAEAIASYMATLKEKSAEYRGQKQILLDREYRRDSLIQKLELAQREKREKLAAARAALYALPDDGEPLAGLWQPESELKNIAVYPTAYFTETHYQRYDRTGALAALQQNDVDMLLFPDGLDEDEIKSLKQDPSIRFVENRRNDLRFVLFNPASLSLQDTALRRAIVCQLDPQIFAAQNGEGTIVPALSWIHPENSGWYTGAITPPCADLDADARLAEGVRILKMEGYAWEQAPSQGRVGSGLKSPAGENLPALTILAPQTDPSRVAAASYVAEKLTLLGIPVQMDLLGDDSYFYALYGSRNYDLALAGWRLSFYPDYLCHFFGAENLYGYQNPDVEKLCDQFSATSDLAAARELLFKIEVLLWDDLPAAPLFSTTITEAYRNSGIPFSPFLGGFAPSLYGAPMWLTRGE